MNILPTNDIYNGFHMDDIDFRIVSLMVLGKDNKEISFTLKIPLSTIQRRTRRILQSGMVKVEYQPNFKLLGIAKGMLHTYLRNGKLRTTAEKISEMEGILSCSIHVGNSDIVSEFVYEDSEDLVDIIAEIKELEGVDRVLWSEEIFKLTSHKDNIMKSFNKYWNNNTNQEK
ncbi:MAG TPA: Lrp/AsnC family transcriptional regulator [Nitrososphaeraceae archaeon]|jgi:DNA-binding Lrp family transcriptional regulator|nr:Lrp/AsnC family transcriptional regulator [Nitrososphaeraceae archaeon]